jgi:hypothetical protein
MAGVKKLNELYHAALGPSNCVLLHPGDSRGYSDQELEAVNKRDFETRLFITATQCLGDTVFLRTHHTDNVKHACFLNYVRDYLKAAHSTKNLTCAKATLTSLLTMCFQLNSSDYCTFATTLASGLSHNSKNIDFEINDMMVTDESEIDFIRFKFCFLMDVIFSKMSTKKYLLDDGKSNIFRLVYCNVKHRKGSKKSLFVAIFSFSLQLCLTIYVLLENYNTPVEEYFSNPEMIPLAVFTFIFSFMVAVPSVMDTRAARSCLFETLWTPMAIMDFLVNSALPILLPFSGFILILSQDDFIDAVLNVTALLFIPEIDDQLSLILGVHDEDIITNFLIAKAVTDFDDFRKMPAEQLCLKTIKERNMVCDGQFGDFYITNLPEEGNVPQKGVCYQPYQVTKCVGGYGHQIDPSTVVTTACLLKKIVWKFTTGFPRATSPRVGFLQLHKINGEIVEIERKEDPTGFIGLNPHSHTLEGMFIITCFQMSEDVIKLRVCGSYNPNDFLKAFDYYSLWDMTDEAVSLVEGLVSKTSSKED